MKGQACTEGGRYCCQKDESMRMSQVLLPKKMVQVSKRMRSGQQPCHSFPACSRCR